MKQLFVLKAKFLKKKVIIENKKLHYSNLAKIRNKNIDNIFWNSKPEHSGIFCYKCSSLSSLNKFPRKNLINFNPCSYLCSFYPFFDSHGNQLCLKVIFTTPIFNMSLKYLDKFLWVAIEKLGKVIQLCINSILWS